MTYCVGMLLDEGLVFLSDSRTNAGIDHINTFRKFTLFERPGDRVIVLQSSGNLAITQALVSMLRQQLAEHANGEPVTSLLTVDNLFDAARHVGETLREVHRRDGAALKEFGIDFSAAFLLGGQIAGEAPRLFSIYAAGNFIEASAETPYFQIGEAKYGKPIIDRVLTRDIPLAEAAKCALISMDSTIRSNLSVGLPLDLVIIRSDALQVASHHTFDQHDAYLQMIHSAWGESLRHAFDALPNPRL